MEQPDWMKAIIKKEQERYPESHIEVKEVTQELLDEMLVDMSKRRFIEEATFYYDDEDNPLENTWIDVEGEGYGWAWMNVEETPEAWHTMMENRVKEYVSKRAFDGQALVSRQEDTVTYRLFNRENWHDIAFTFSDKHWDDESSEEDTSFFDDLQESLQQLDAYANGDDSGVTVRVVTLDKQEES